MAKKDVENPCSECEEEEATVTCDGCGDSWCDDCKDDVYKCQECGKIVCVDCADEHCCYTDALEEAEDEIWDRLFKPA